jgi:hypothetical protein
MKSRVLSESMGGTLKGAYAPPLDGVELPELTLKPSKVYNVRPPAGGVKCVPGMQFRRKVDNEMVTVTIPEGFDILKAGRFKYTRVGDVDKVIATTLPMVPGYDVALSKPIVFGCETKIFDDRGYSGKPTLAKIIAQLTQDAQNQLNSLAIEHDCNAVLSVQFSVAMSHEADGKGCKVAVTCFGTPCVIVPSANTIKTSNMPKEPLFAEGTTTDDRTVHSAYTEVTGMPSNGGGAATDPAGYSASEDLPLNVGVPRRKISTVSLLREYPQSEDEEEEQQLPHDLAWSSPVHEKARMTIQSGHIPEAPM